MDAFLARHLQGVSRTYAIVIPMLPKELREPVGLAYLLMRVVDTYEDFPPLSSDERRARFEALEKVLSDDAAPVPDFLAEPIGENPAERQLMHELPVLIDRLRALEPAYRDAAYYGAHEMMRGVRIFLRRAEERGRPYPAVQTPEEMREYCYFVAGVVGIFLNQMMAHYLGMPQLLQLRELSVELGIGLQLVNVLKDALKDSEQGRRYLPAVEDGRLEPADVYRIALDEARRSLRRGVDFVLALPAHAAELRHFCGLPIAWGALTLERAERDAAGAKINRATLMDSIVRFKQLATDDQALRDWLSGMLRKDDQAFAASNRS